MIGRPPMSIEERFWAKVDKSGDCWVWTDYLTFGYGHLRIGQAKVRAHRYAYELLVGPIPEGLTLDHLCRNRACVNPAHLEPVTNRENILRGVCPTALNAAKTHCVHGHEFTPENTAVLGDGERACRACARARDRAYKQKRRAVAVWTARELLT